MSRPRWIAAAVLVALVPLLLHAAPLISAVLVAVVLLTVAVADARRARGRPPEKASSPL